MLISWILIFDFPLFRVLGGYYTKRTVGSQGESGENLEHRIQDTEGNGERQSSRTGLGKGKKNQRYDDFVVFNALAKTDLNAEMPFHAAVLSYAKTEIISKEDWDLVAFEKDQGFLTNLNRHVDRKEGREIAIAADQILDMDQLTGILYSENLW